MKQLKRSRRGSPLLLRIKAYINEATRNMLKLSTEESAIALDFIDLRTSSFRALEPTISGVEPEIIVPSVSEEQPVEPIEIPMGARSA